MKLVDREIYAIAKNPSDARSLQEAVRQICNQHELSYLPDDQNSLVLRLLRYSERPKHALNHNQRAAITRLIDSIICRYNLHPNVSNPNRWLSLSHTHNIPQWLEELFAYNPSADFETRILRVIQQPKTFTPRDFIDKAPQTIPSYESRQTEKLKAWLQDSVCILMTRYPTLKLSKEQVKWYTDNI